MRFLLDLLVGLVLGAETGLAAYFIGRALIAWRISTMPWLNQKDNTTHCAAIAFYNMCKIYEVWWLPFWACKLLLRTDRKSIFKNKTAGTAWEDLTWACSLVFGLAKNQLIWHESHSDILWRQIRTIHKPMLVGYSFRGQSYHAITIWSRPDGVLTFNHAEHVNVFYTWREWDHEFAHIVHATQEKYGSPIRVIVPWAEVKHEAKFNITERELLKEIDLVAKK